MSRRASRTRASMRRWCSPSARSRASGVQASRRAWLARADECTHERAVDSRHVYVFPGLEEEITGVLGAIDASRLEIDRLETSLAELGSVLTLLERAGHAPDPELDAAADLKGHLAPHHDVRYREASTRSKDAKRLGENAILVGRQIDHAVGDDDVHGVVRKGNRLDLSLEKLDVVDTGLLLVLAGQGQHFVGHVESVGLATRSHAFGREQHVDPAAGAQVEHRLAGAELGECRRVAAAERGCDGRRAERGRLTVAVQVGGDRVHRVGVTASARRAAGGLTARHHLQRRLPVLVLPDLLDVLVSHRWSSRYPLAYEAAADGAQQ